VAELGTGVRTGSLEADSSSRNGHRSRRRARRRSLPGGRAVIGGLLVAASAVGLFSVSTRAQSGPRQSYVVVRHAVAPGARLTEADLARLPVELPPELQRHAFKEIRTLVGATVVAPLAAGDLVQASAVVAKPSAPGSREVTFGVARQTLAANLEQGERVDVVATYGSGADAYSTVVLRQALVVGLDRGRERVGSGDDASITVAVDDPDHAVALAHAVQLAKLTVVRATGAAPLDDGQPSYRQAQPAGSGRQ
jgi:hypothetical protein